MTNTLHLTKNPEAAIAPVITIVGGGFTGSTIAVQQARHYISLYERDHNLPPLTIRIIDEQGSFGPGLPYSTPDNVFLLNQPAYAMSPFPDDPDHFTRWLGGDGNAFATRHQYGEYLKGTLTQVFNDAAAAGIPVKLETLTGDITDINPYKDGFVLSRKNGTQLETKALVLATGHQKSTFLSELDINGRYFSGVHDVVKIGNILKKDTSKDSVAIVGTGQSMVDALAVLDHIGYKGKIYAFSRSLVEPWAFDPELYKKALPPYVPFYLDPERIRDEKDFTFDGLRARLDLEFKWAESQGYGVGHVLTAIDFKALATAGPNGTAPEGLQALYNLWEKIYGNPTAPERHELLERYKKSGQLVLVRNEVQAKDIVAEKDGFIANGIAGKKQLYLSAIFNAAAFNRKSLASPLLQKAADKNLLHLRSDVIEPGRQNHTAIFAAGPPTSPAKWGVETFRNDNALTARQSVETALGLNIKQQRRKP